MNNVATGRSVASPPAHASFPCAFPTATAALTRISPVYLQEFGGDLFKRLPRRVREGMRDSGICHYLAVFKQKDGSLVQARAWCCAPVAGVRCGCVHAGLWRLGLGHCQQGWRGLSGADGRFGNGRPLSSLHMLQFTRPHHLCSHL